MKLYENQCDDQFLLNGNFMMTPDGAVTFYYIVDKV